MTIVYKYEYEHKDSTQKGFKEINYNIDMEKKDLKKLSKSQLIKMLLKQEKKKSEIIVVDDTKPTPPPRTGKWKNVKPKPVPRKSVKQMVKEHEAIIQPPEQFRDGYKPIPKPRTDRPKPSRKPPPPPSTKRWFQLLR